MTEESGNADIKKAVFLPPHISFYSNIEFLNILWKNYKSECIMF